MTIYYLTYTMGIDMTPLSNRYTVYFNSKDALDTFVNGFMKNTYQEGYNEIIGKGKAHWNSYGILIPK